MRNIDRAMTPHLTLKLASRAYALAFELNNHSETEGAACRAAFQSASLILSTSITLTPTEASMVDEAVISSGEYSIAALKAALTEARRKINTYTIETLEKAAINIGDKALERLCRAALDGDNAAWQKCLNEAERRAAKYAREAERGDYLRGRL